jgi:hypothetical protein
MSGERDVEERAKDAWAHFNNKVRDKVQGEYGEFTNADWQAAVALDAEICRLRIAIAAAARELTSDELWDVEAEGPPGDWCLLGGGPRTASKASRVAAYHHEQTGEATRLVRAPTNESEPEDVHAPQPGDKGDDR